MGPTPLHRRDGREPTDDDDRAIAARQHAGEDRVRYLNRREREDGRHRLQLRRIKVHRGHEADMPDRLIDGDIDRPKPRLDGADKRGDAIEVGEIGRECGRLDAGATEFGDALVERRGPARDECDSIAFAPKSRSERGAKASACAENGNRFRVSHNVLQGGMFC